MEFGDGNAGNEEIALEALEKLRRMLGASKVVDQYIGVEEEAIAHGRQAT